VSLDAGGITFPDGTFQSSAASGSTITAGAGMTLAGSTLGIDPTAVIHVAGVSSDGGATFGGPIKTQFLTIDNADAIISSSGTVKVLSSGSHGLYSNPFDGTTRLLYGGSSSKSLEVGNGYNKSNQLFIASAGISSDGGITMNAGEYLRWTDNDSIRSVGGVFRFNASGTNVLNMTPSMLDIKTNMNVEGLAHFEAGISSDAGITVGNLNIDGYRIKDFSNTTDFVDFGANRVDFYQNNDRMLKINGSTSVIVGSSSEPKALQVFGTQSISDLLTTSAGISMNTAGITFPDGTHQTTAPVTGSSGVTHVAGFLFDGRGTTVAAAKKTDIVRPVEGTATITELGIRLPEGAGGGTASASVYKVGENYINESGVSLAADGITVGTIDLENGLYGGTASGGGTMAYGDLIFCGVTGAGLGKIVQVFVTYEV